LIGAWPGDRNITREQSWIHGTPIKTKHNPRALDTWYTQEGQVENNRSRNKIESEEPEDKKNDDIDIDEEGDSTATAGTKGKTRNRQQERDKKVGRRDIDTNRQATFSEIEVFFFCFFGAFARARVAKPIGSRQALEAHRSSRFLASRAFLDPNSS
jgi:hypothetical protein